uniref:Uncharacterized protein n=1 Tax=Rhizophora mucronata TaxID=61149 RepID=A0A2P2PYZ2_RHIMU
MHVSDIIIDTIFCYICCYRYGSLKNTNQEARNK